MFKDPKQVDLFGGLLAAAMIAGAAFLFSVRAVKPYIQTRAELGSFEEAVQILSDAEGSVDRLDAEIRRVGAEIAASEALLPRDLNLDSFLEQLGDLAASTGTRIEKLTPFGVEEYRLYRALPLEVTVSGSFLAIYEFLDRVENGARLSRIEELKMRGRRSEGECEAEMRLALYFAHEEMN
ncbi:MAG: type 4a pilus biogenesis protein PilO [Candidatus Eisenbacteria bacterium]|nr:type 4a pilus biogenesis protein PilO [Candidatus Eisenbacteria bacterium]